LGFPGRLIGYSFCAGARVTPHAPEPFLHFAACIANGAFHAVFVHGDPPDEEEPDGVEKVPCFPFTSEDAARLFTGRASSCAYRPTPNFRRRESECRSDFANRKFAPFSSNIGAINSLFPQTLDSLAGTID
jgi:hypothetical protein